ncbi:phage antirepressor KilAC domain-containing protein [Collinsella tanakaei]|nr:phage antirepressor KilAC domain-containing protein [Collinsella tanakaei]
MQGFRSLERDCRSLSRLDEDEKSKFNLGLPGGPTNCVSFPGLLSLILSSRKKEAKAYKRWVTHDVLPAIHKNGGYMVARPDETPLETVSRALLIAKDTMDRQAEQIGALESEVHDMLPKVSMAENLIECEGTYTVTEAARLLRQVDGSMSRRRLFQRLRDDGMVEKRGNGATAKSVERGYLVNVCTSFTAPDGTRIARAPYALVTPKGLAWCTSRYCVPQRQLSIVGEAM